jgi:hypothetical protein
MREMAHQELVKKTEIVYNDSGETADHQMGHVGPDDR